MQPCATSEPPTVLKYCKYAASEYHRGEITQDRSLPGFPIPECYNYWRSPKCEDKIYCDDCRKLRTDFETTLKAEEKDFFTPKELPEDEIKTKMKPFYFITINPKNTVKPEEFFEYINTYMATSEYTRDQRYVYAFEQRGDSADTIHGYHCHLLLEKRIPRPENMYVTLRKALFRMDWIGDNKHVDVKHIGTQDLPKVMNYITGTKSDEEKQAKQICDVLMRRKYELQPFYKNKVEKV